MMAQPVLPTISIGNKDLKKAFIFMVILATVIEDMSNDIQNNHEINVDYQKYQDRAEQDRLVYEKLFDDFIDEIFGEFDNRVKKEKFIANLDDAAWKYFDAKWLRSAFISEKSKMTADNKKDLVLNKMFAKGLAAQMSHE